MPFNRQKEFECSQCDGRSFTIVQGTTCIYLTCTKCDNTDEISRRKLGWDV